MTPTFWNQGISVLSLLRPDMVPASQNLGATAGCNSNSFQIIWASSQAPTLGWVWRLRKNSVLMGFR